MARRQFIILFGLIFLALGLVLSPLPVKAENLRRIVIFSQDTPVEVQEAIVQASSSTILQRLSPFPALVIQLPPDQPQVALDILQSYPEVEAIEEDTSITAQSLAGGIQGSFVTPIDPQTGKEQYTDHGYRWSMRQIYRHKVEGTDGDRVRVAVLDTGIDTTHPDLSRVVRGGYNARAGEDPADYTDRNGHGTHIAGIIAGNLTQLKVKGMAPKAKLYAVRVLDDAGGGYLSDLINGLLWVYNHPEKNIRVVNMSLGFYQGSTLLHQVIQWLEQQGVIMVASVGNYDCTIPASEGGDSEGGDSEGGDSEGGDSEGGDSSSGCTWQVKYPAQYPETIAVGATDETGNIASYSVEGLAVDVVAPGGSGEMPVISTNLNSGYGLASGTSQATAHVSGLVALLLDANPDLTPQEVRQILQETAIDLDEPWEAQGAGLVDTEWAVDEAKH